MRETYILRDGVPTPESDLLRWSAWMVERGAERVVGLTETEQAQVSTVFLGLDMSRGGAVPVLWETMIFGGRHHGLVRRYTSRLAAEAGHAATVLLVEGVAS